MLKKTTLSLILSSFAIFASSQVMAATVYKTDDTSFAVGGRVQANINSKYASRKGEKGDISTKARLNLKGNTKVYNDIKALAFAEWEIAAATSQNGKIKTRYAYVGFDSDAFGQMVFGQNDTAMYNVVGKTDIFTEWGDTGNVYRDLGNSEKGLDAGRQEGQAVYHYQNKGLDLGASYQTAGLEGVESGYALSAGYEFDFKLPFGIYAAYDNYQLEEKNNWQDKDTLAGALTLGTFGDGFYASAMYNYNNYEHGADKKGYELVAAYAFENSLQFILGYENLTADGAKLVSDVVFEAQYKPASNFKTYLLVQCGVGDIDKVDALNYKIGSTNERSKDKFSIGLQYNF